MSCCYDARKFNRVQTHPLVHDAIESPDDDEIEKYITVFEEECRTEERRNDDHDISPVNHRNAPTTPAYTHSPGGDICDGCNREPAEINRESREGDVLITPCEGSCVFSELNMCFYECHEEAEHDED